MADFVTPKHEVESYIEQKLQSDRKRLIREIDDRIWREWVPGGTLEFEYESSRADYPIRDFTLIQVSKEFAEKGWTVNITRMTGQSRTNGNRVTIFEDYDLKITVS